MSDPNTLRILEIDGGGERGYLSLCWLQKFLTQWGIDEATNPLWKKFDVICGTSVGGIMALSLASGQVRVIGANPTDPNDPTAMSTFFLKQGPYIFSLGWPLLEPHVTPPSPSIRPSSASKVALITADIPFYQSSAPYEFEYGAGLLHKTIQDTFKDPLDPLRDLTLQDLKTNVVIPTFENITKRFIVCSNLNYSEFSGQDELISNVAIATGAAPVYLPSLTLSSVDPRRLNGTYIDGGVYQNNPAQFGYTMGQMIKPNANRICMLSLGTGLGQYGFNPPPPPGPLTPSDILDSRINPEIKKWIMESPEITPTPGSLLDSYCTRHNIVSPTAFNTLQGLFELFSIASTGGQESVAQAQILEAKYTLNQFYNYRFQPILDPLMDPELDNTDPAVLTYYKNTAETAYDTDIENITNFLGHLTA